VFDRAGIQRRLPFLIVNCADIYRPIQAKVLVVSVDSDILFPPAQQLCLHKAILTGGVDVDYVCHHSTYGHDAFLVETEAFGQYLQNFIGAFEERK